MSNAKAVEKSRNKKAEQGLKRLDLWVVNCTDCISEAKKAIARINKKYANKGV